jgi:antitoxin component of RelBE/YafQ-DinJ toxin-antitoxin module
MPRANAAPKAMRVTVRIEPDLKAELKKLAAQSGLSLSQLMRDLARERMAREERQAFEAEARRQSLAIAERAKNPNSDEAEAMRWIEAANDIEGWET